MPPNRLAIGLYLLALAPAAPRAAHAIEPCARPSPDGRVSKRCRRVPAPPRRLTLELKDPRLWPPEPPEPPGGIEADRFVAVVAELCRPVAGRTDTAAVAGQVLAAARAAGADPFLLAALVYRQSRCRPEARGPGGIGLLHILPAMFEPGAHLPFAASDLAPERLLDPAHNLRVGAALLAMWEVEHPALDRDFPGTPHRTGLAHFVWGDRVFSASGEDRALIARRRLLESYTGAAPQVQPSAIGESLASPLGGAPRLATSGPGAERNGGARVHHGIDIDATAGEPVCSVADGEVLFAGADTGPGREIALPIHPEASSRFRYRALGPGGLFVRVEHAGGVRTSYFHLSSFTVVAGQKVRAGEMIGRVGRTGIKAAGSHLHFEIERNRRQLNPVRALAAFVIPPEATHGHERSRGARRAPRAYGGSGGGSSSAVR